MTCAEFIRWLDDGQPETGEAAARAHAVACVHCAAELDAARELDALLAQSLTPAPARVTDTVMARVAAIESVRAANPRAAMAPPVLDPFAWWVRAAAQPAAALALMLAAVTLWQRDALGTFARMMVTAVSGWASSWIATTASTAAVSLPAAEALARPEVMLGLVFAITPLIVWSSWSLWRWAERKV